MDSSASKSALLIGPHLLEGNRGGQKLKKAMRDLSIG